MESNRTNIDCATLSAKPGFKSVIALKNRAPMKNNQFGFPVNMVFRPRDWSHWIRLEILFCFVVFMCPELRYGPGLVKIDFGILFKSMLEFWWVLS